jgi:enoyl-CoA hydratase
LDLAAYQHIDFSRAGRVLVITLNRPAQRNAVNGRLHAELATVFIEAQRDADSDVIVLTGAGSAFCAGGDIAWMQQGVDDPAHFERTGREGKDILFSQLDLEKPLICAMNGHATGLGASLALLCDVVIAAQGAKIGDPHVSVGLVAGDGGALIWPQLIGYARAKRYLLTGDLLSAAEAERLGLVSEVVADDQVLATALALAQRLAAGATQAIRWTKITSNLPLKALIHAHFDAGLAYELLSNRTADHADAVAVFRERRAPKFSGC